MDHDASPASKAAGFTTTAEVVREDCDDAAWVRLLEALPGETRALIERPPLAVSWLEIRHFGRLIETAQEEVYQGHAEGIARVARRSIFRDLSSFYRMFIRVASPMFVIGRAATIWGKYNKNHGEMIASSSGPRSARVIIRNVAIGSPAFWAYQRGAILAALDATGFPDGTVETTSGGGRDHAELSARW